MARERFLKLLRWWHDNGEDQKVFDAVASIPCEERDYGLNITLLQLYIYRCDDSKMEALRRWLESVRSQGGMTLAGIAFLAW